jgi:hypothetical protein
MHLDAEKEMMSQCVALLGKFIAVREPNIRYLGLVIAFLINIYLINAFCWQSCFRIKLCKCKIYHIETVIDPSFRKT